MPYKKAYTDSEWGDLLTSYDGTDITYDEIGNPISYYNGSAYTFTWEGRRLVGAVKGSTNMSFTYDDAGIRTSKTVNGVTHTYYLNGSQIMAEEWEDKLLVYIYDASGMPMGMMYRETAYDILEWDVFWYEKNLQGDIVAVYDESGTKLATYTYADAWGKHGIIYINDGASTPVQYNPFRYRGYYYDTDLEMFYLQSRYYDAKICRFISPDSVSYLGANGDLISYNLYAYCSNNPVNYVDPSGHFIDSFWDAFSLGLSIVDVACNPYNMWSWLGLAGDVIDLIPFVTGVGEAADLLRLANIGSDIIDVADDVHDAANIVDGAIDTYKNLRKVNKGNGLEVHHIIEKRFARYLDINKSEMLSIALTHNEHVVFTKQWRAAIPYKTSYSIEDIWNAAQDIYANYPALLQAARKTLWR